MSLKSNVISTMLFTAITGASLSANAAPAADVTLTGIITNTTCDITVNGGQATLNVGTFKTADITGAGVLTQVGDTPLPVALTCNDTENMDSAMGSLVVQGNTSNLDVSNKLFTSVTTGTVGFMLKLENNTDNIVANQPVPVTGTAGASAYDYTYKVGMASATNAAPAGAYSAPITVAYLVN